MKLAQALTATLAAGLLAAGPQPTAPAAPPKAFTRAGSAFTRVVNNKQPAALHRRVYADRLVMLAMAPRSAPPLFESGALADPLPAPLRRPALQVEKLKQRGDDHQEHIAQEVVAQALALSGLPYVWGSAGPAEFDCSGLTQYVYRSLGLLLPHSAAEQYDPRYGTLIEDPEGLLEGDLVFFADTYKPGISHVGIYVGEGYVLQAISEQHGVGVTHLTEPYWAEHYAGALRPHLLVDGGR